MSRLELRSATRILGPIAKNPIPPEADEAEVLCAIIGEEASRTARSPAVWNAAFRRLGWKALLIPIDLDRNRLAEFVTAARDVPSLRGFAVTMPFKIDVLPKLNHVDDTAERIGAVNVVARTDQGWAGHNTDATGFLRSLTGALPGQSAPFLPALDGRRALVLGAGGAANAVAHALADRIGPKGEITVTNRSASTGRDLVRRLGTGRTSASFRTLDEVRSDPARWDLLVNASSVGQAGIRTLGEGITCLEAYSPLAVANPSVLPEARAADASAFHREWFAASSNDIAQNNVGASDFCRWTPSSTVFVDLIFSPVETLFLRQARWSGHRTLNGRLMNLCQAADAFTQYILPTEMVRRGLDPERDYGRVMEAMATA